MERYLFKAKKTDNGEWETGSLVILSDKKTEICNRIINPPDSDPMWRRCVVSQYVDPDTICQCVGLNDKNGNLIWKNDIVNFLGHKGIIVFECGSFGIAYKAPIDWRGIEANILPITGCDNVLYACANDNFISLWEIYWNFNDEDDCLSTVEVVGNIFDNPELLESEG